MKSPTTLTSTKAFTKALVSFCLGIVGIFMCGCCLANCLKNSTIQMFGDTKNHCTTLNILSPNAMDDETLFLAAAAQREGNMSATDRLLNNRWLMQSKQNTFAGGTALRAILKMSVQRFWDSNRPQRPLNKIQNDAPKLAIFNWNNYDLEVSGNRVIVGFSYRF